MTSEPYAIKAIDLVDNWEGKEFQVRQTENFLRIRTFKPSSAVGFYVNDYYHYYPDEYLVVRDIPKPPSLETIIFDSWVSYPPKPNNVNALADAIRSAGFHHESECAK